MNLSQLEAFAETCRLGSYTRAAERLYISQPALHQKVKALEHELGAPLLIVRDRRVVPTAEGQVVLETAERVVHEVRALEAHFRHAASSSSVHVGATSLLAVTALSDAVALYRGRYPESMVHVLSLDPDELYDALVSGRIDLAVAYRDYVTTDLETEPLVESHVICAAARGHPLADGRAHRADELLRYPIALTVKGMGMRTKIERWFEQVAGVHDLPVAFEARTAALLAQVAATSTDLVTFLPERALPQFNLARILLEGPPIPSIAVICYLPSPERRPAVARFLETLRSFAATGAPA
jgi:DNA-binding transcriptional LysR family regulator